MHLLPSAEPDEMQEEGVDGGGCALQAAQFFCTLEVISGCKDKFKQKWAFSHHYW